MNVAELAVEGIGRFGEYRSWHFEDRWYSNVELVDLSCRLASVLEHQGIARGHRVVVMIPSCMEAPAAFHALARLGSVTVPVMPQLIAAEVTYIVENSGADTVLTSSDLVSKIEEATQGLAGFQQILAFGPSETGTAVDLSPLLETASPHQAMCDSAADDLAVLIYTSGTTGHPKGVMLSHRNLISNIRGAAQLFDGPTGERSLMVLPMSHVYGMLLMNLGAVLGGVIVLLRTFDPQQVLQAIQDFRIERCSLVPAMQVALIHCPQRNQYDVSCLKIVTGGSAALPEDVRSEFERVFGCRVVDGYGQSEATCAVSGYRDGEEFVAGSAGRQIPGVEVCVQDDNNQPLSAGETGEICVQGPGVMLGYWNNEEATRSAIIDGWLHSGDIGHVDERGYIYITDRKKDMIIKGGENISPREIEEAIAGLPEVAEVSVYGVPDERFQEEMAASIVVRQGHRLSEERVLRCVAEHVAKFKLPRYVMFAEALPRNSNGKVLKRTLQEQWTSARSSWHPVSQQPALS